MTDRLLDWMMDARWYVALPVAVAGLGLSFGLWYIAMLLLIRA